LLLDNRLPVTDKHSIMFIRLSTQPLEYGRPSTKLICTGTGLVDICTPSHRIWSPAN